MGLPRTYRTSGEAPLISFSWIDWVAATGVVRFYGARQGNLAGTTYNLSQQTNFSDSKNETGWEGIDISWVQGATTSYVKHLDLDFDLSAFQSPVTIRGTANIQQGFYWEEDAGTEVVKMVYVLKKVSEGVETDIGTGTSTEYNISTDDEYGVLNITIALTETDFKIGDILRLTVEAWSKDAGGGTANATNYIGIDPKDRVGTKIDPSAQNSTTQLICDVPFRVPQI